MPLKNKKVIWNFSIKLFFIGVALLGAWKTPEVRNSRELQFFVFVMCAAILFDGYYSTINKVVRTRLSKWFGKTNR